MKCHRCKRAMIRVVDYWVCGHHAPPVFVSVGNSHRPMQPAIGTRLGAIDADGRVTLPARLRLGLAPSPASAIYMLPKPDPCLALFSEDSYRLLLDKVAASDATEEEKDAFLRFIEWNTEIGVLDARGRLRISDRLLHHTCLDKQIVIIGRIHSVEVWDENVWKKRCEGLMPIFECINRRVGI